MPVIEASDSSRATADRQAMSTPSESGNTWFRRFGNVASKVEAAFFPTFASKREATRRYLFGLSNFPIPPQNPIVADQEQMRRLRRSLARNRNLVVTGRSGTGKTTLAMEAHRMFVDGLEDSNRTLTPVFIRMPKEVTEEDIHDQIQGLIANSVSSRWGYYKTFVAKNWLAAGALLVILDDLEYLKPARLKRLQEFINTESPHCYVCITSEKIDTEDWEKFDVFQLAEWKAAAAKSYINNRINDETRSLSFINSLELLNLLDRKFSALEWKYLVDIYERGTIFEVFQVPGLQTKTDYNIQRDYLKIAAERVGLSWDMCLETVGRMALRLLKERSASFDITSVGVDRDIISKLTPMLFESYENSLSSLSFQSDKMQWILAGCYLGERWPHSRIDLEGEHADWLVWSAAFSCTSNFISEKALPDLRNAFIRLAHTPTEQEVQADPKKARFRTTPLQHASRNLLQIGNEKSGILESSMRNLIEEGNLDYLKTIGVLGKFALTLVNQKRSSFDAKEAKETLGTEIWEALRPREAVRNLSGEIDSYSQIIKSPLFVSQQDRITFDHPKQQAFLVGKCLSEFWHDVKEDLPQYLELDSFWREVITIVKVYLPTEAMADFIMHFQRESEVDQVAWRKEFWQREYKSTFELLIEKKILGALRETELDALEGLRKIRTVLLSPKSKDELDAQKGRSEAHQNLMLAFEEYLTKLEC